MLSKIAQYNLKRDKKVLGKEWLKTYNNYFSDRKNILMFIKAVKPLLPKKELDILYVASASGLLGEELLKSLRKARLTLVDISRKHLEENSNPKTKKICCDLLKLDLKKKFDLIIMRSSLDYFPSKKSQIKVLKKIKKHLATDGLFVNQPACISDIRDREIMSRIYSDVNKIGDRYFQSSDLSALYFVAGFKSFKKIGASKDLIVKEKEHIERYGISKGDVEKIRNLIRNGSKFMKKTKNGYTLRFEFPIFIAKV